ncbi:protein traS [Salmonella enterica]|uniref:protein traS n=1 Tax=Salmonella enterica TaxID=28901 RepID=UPI000BE46C56|nr:protein traS [Salmonella enterica subsp. enterica]EAA2699890.1 protein traS [Salmonella enterica]ECH8185408.1 protein traS [Salmonella enterica subsp. enterica serovar Rissen]ECL7195393.1 protein traS [Salmonella enterica subsp. enterica serovar Muenchen]EEJ6875493.1 protein traS [Salmonella enterica subsp. houtenae]EGF6410288.1 protein traS [Salmonella enterica subsp. enterica serovar 6,8:d:-]EHF3503828.1 protein traS [Salmonella enterica subsp. enterica serovar 6,8,20:d-]
MITQQTVRQELETLKRYIDSGGVRIPSLWSSMRMGVSIVAWMIFCSVIMSFFITQKTSETLMSVLFGGWIGFIIMLVVAKMRMLYLSLPENFVKESLLAKTFSSKVKLYYITYLILIFFFSIAGGIVYCFGSILLTVIMTFLFSLDIGRYKVAGVVEVINSYIKSRQ